MSVHGVGIVGLSISLTVSGYAANPFVDAKDDEPVSANFRGTEWNDEFSEHGIPHDIPLTARIITTRIAKMPWGAIFKIEFTDAKSRAPEEHEIPPPRYFIVTDDRIVLLNEEDNEAAAKKISAMDKPPNSSRTTFTESPPAASSTKRGHGKRQLMSRAICVFSTRIIPPVISQTLFGKKGLD